MKHDRWRALLLAALCFLPLGCKRWLSSREQPALRASAELSIRNVTDLSGAELLSRPFAAHVIVSEHGRFMYCPVPKAANSNWKYLVRKFEGMEDYADLSKAHIPARSGLRYLSDYSPREVDALLTDPSYFKFVFVRDPYARLVSCYMDKFRSRSPAYVQAEYRNFLAQLFNWRYARGVDLEANPRPSFRAFVDELAKHDPESMNPHWMPQSLHCGFGEMPYDFVGRMETLLPDARYVLDKLGKHDEQFPTQEDIGFPPSGASPVVADQLYTLDLMLKVRVIFDHDFRALGYS